VVFLASSDFTHYGRGFGYVPFPADSAVAFHLRELDFECAEAAGSLDSSLFLKRWSSAEPPSAVPAHFPAARCAASAGRRRNLPGDPGLPDIRELTGDYRQSVSYAALGYFRRAAFDLDAPDREALLDSAAETLRRLRQTGEREPSRRTAAPMHYRHAAAVS